MLSSIYYLSVVVLEVPSGWMSDRLGRVTTVRVAAVSWIVSHALFLVGDDTFWVIALAQFFLAGGYASLSGTDVTLPYDTLEALGRESEFADRETRVSAIGYSATAPAALARPRVVGPSSRTVVGRVAQRDELDRLVWGGDRTRPTQGEPCHRE